MNLILIISNIIFFRVCHKILIKIFDIQYDLETTFINYIIKLKNINKLLINSLDSYHILANLFFKEILIELYIRRGSKIII